MLIRMQRQCSSAQPVYTLRNSISSSWLVLDRQGKFQNNSCQKANPTTGDPETKHCIMYSATPCPISISLSYLKGLLPDGVAAAWVRPRQAVDP